MLPGRVEPRIPIVAQDLLLLLVLRRAIRFLPVQILEPSSSPRFDLTKVLFWCRGRSRLVLSMAVASGRVRRIQSGRGSLEACC